MSTTNKTKRQCREVHFKNGEHTHTFIVERTVYTRADGTQYVECRKKRLAVHMELDYPTYEVHSKNITFKPIAMKAPLPVLDDEIKPETEEEIAHSPVCPACNALSDLLGTLGKKNHFKCRACGLTFYKEVES